MLDSIYNKLKTLNVPVAYRFFPEGQNVKMPYVVYYSTGQSNFSADGQNYFTTTGLIVELYTKHKDVELEKRLESKLDFAIWDKVENYVDDERCYMMTYTMEV